MPVKKEKLPDTWKGPSPSTRHLVVAVFCADVIMDVVTPTAALLNNVQVYNIQHVRPFLIDRHCEWKAITRFNPPHCFQIGLHFHLLAQLKTGQQTLDNRKQKRQVFDRVSPSRKTGRRKVFVKRKELNNLGSTRRPNGGKENRTKLTFKTREIKVRE